MLSIINYILAHYSSIALTILMIDRACEVIFPDATVLFKLEQILTRLGV